MGWGGGGYGRPYLTYMPHQGGGRGQGGRHKINISQHSKPLSLSLLVFLPNLAIGPSWPDHYSPKEPFQMTILPAYFLLNFLSPRYNTSVNLSMEFSVCLKTEVR